MVKISKLILTNFRNFKSKKLDFSNNIILFCGVNGVGKTNILESLVLLSRGQQIRSSDFDQMVKQNFDKKESFFNIFAEINDHDFIENIAINYDLKSSKKTLAINSQIQNQKRQSDIKSHIINSISLTPKIEQLFISPKSTRRDYLDKIVQDIDVSHNSRVQSYQKLLKERLLILQKSQNSNSNLYDKWLNSIETKIVENSVAIAAARNEAIEFFNKAIINFSSNFPKPELVIKGDVENLIKEKSALELEQIYQQKLKENRQQDLANFKTNFGVHRSDFDAIFFKNDKKISATLCSTGEQKAIMISITLARGQISAKYKQNPTIMIFDEVVAHLDDDRKKNLFDEIIKSNIQTFLSATSIDLIDKKYQKILQNINLAPE